MADPCLRVRRARRLCPLVLLVGAACSHGGGATPPAVPTFAVVDLFPPDGAVAMGTRTVVEVRFSEPVTGLGLEDLTVEDGAGPLPGLLGGGIDGRTWHWTPQRDLPLGAELRVRLAASVRSAGGSRPSRTELGSFRVREQVASPALGLGTNTGESIAALCWPSGHMLAVNGAVAHDVGAPAATQWTLPLVGAPIGCVRDEIGGFVTLGRQGLSPFVLDAVHASVEGSSLASTVAAVSSAYGRVELVGNARGDAAVYVYGLTVTQAAEELWFSRAGTATWTEVPLALAGTYPLRRLAIDGDGNLFVAFLDAAGRLRLQRHDRAAGTTVALDVATAPDEFALAAGANGEVRVFWHARATVGGGEQHLRLARRYRAGALEPAVELHRGARYADRAFASAASGAAVAVFEDLEAQLLYLQRFERDGSVGAPQLIGPSAEVGDHALACAARGEAWFVWIAPDAVGDAVVGVRSRPHAPHEQPRALYQAAIANERVREVAVDVEDSGRVVVTLVEDHVGPVRRVKALLLR